MPCFAANSASVSSPRIASSATLALNSAVYRLRVTLPIQTRPSHRREQLNRLSGFQGPALLFAPHLHRAALVNRQLESCRLAAEGAVAALNRLAQGVIIVDAESRPLFVNGAAERILAEADGLRLGAGGLAAANRAEASTLRRMVADAANGQAGLASRCTLSVTRPSLRRSYSLLVTPLRTAPGWFLARRSGAIVFVRDPEHAPA